MEPFVHASTSTLIIEKWVTQFPNLTIGFTTKLGGVSKNQYRECNLGHHVGEDRRSVNVNRVFVADQIEQPLHNWVSAEQTHGKRIEKITPLIRGRGATCYEDAVKDCDGFYTNHPEILLTLAYADCVPLFFLHPHSKLIGIAHAGWKGTVLGIGNGMVQTWVQDEGVPINEIHVAIGPSICTTCYVVDDPIITRVNETVANPTSFYTEVSSGQYQLDLRGLNREILIEAGINKENILTTNYCSACDQKLFFSHRRDEGKTGRMLGFIGWKG
ncbi:hypothetical protein Q73_05185 [Bacillus coahuilensis m2-6]|uniref:peptidoglycan editing factor PgeF n=1 Tax=Bacillus coahuilensis TaxID=408580 RepID=UPI0007504614|nr:peptidoglycan editing factor PgeF [Bacillus coahuilensis]KUP08586.1 hypothetical protein Q73_05185 [Bacillus coahuilensis m2-6]